MGCLGTYGAAYSPPLRSPLPRSPPPPLGGGAGDPVPGAGGVGGWYWGGSLEFRPGLLPLRRRRLGGVPRAPGAPLRPVASTAPSIGGQCPGAGGATWAQGGVLRVYCGTFEPCTFFRRDSHRARPFRGVTGLRIWLFWRGRLPQAVAQCDGRWPSLGVFGVLFCFVFVAFKAGTLRSTRERPIRFKIRFIRL